jgi:deazaflavin-dependent oxidoreductase (nitroreductase family)
MGRTIARLNKAGLNKVMRHLAPWMPGFGLMMHRGRKSGREFSTPINIFRRDGGYVVCLTYGVESDWVRNVLAAGQCSVITRRHTVRLVNPRLDHDETRHWLPWAPREITGLIDANDFLLLDKE